ncbi:MAG: DMT family transporter [Pseudomonadota bacterium]
MRHEQTTAPRTLVPETVTMGIVLILVAMALITANDMIIKRLSDTYPLHQIVLIRSLIGMSFASVFLMFEGGLRCLRTRRPGLHVIRSLMLVGANLFFFTAIATVTLAEASAVFFIFPMVIALLQWPVLGVPVGPRRLASIGLGFVGVLVILAPWGGGGNAAPAWALALPVAGAVCYALMQLLTRKLGDEMPAAGLAVYSQGGFIVVCAVTGLVLGDGRFLGDTDNASLSFLLRAWVWPSAEDWWLFGLVGCAIGLVAYAMSQAYRVADPATIAPFEYVALPLAVFWGVVIFGDIPDLRTALGILLIAGAGIYVYIRERKVGTETIVAGNRTPR